MRRLRARFAPVASGRLGSPSGPTMWLCRSPAGRGADEGGESRPDQGSSNLPRPHPEVRSPRPKSPQWSAARRCASGRPSSRTRCRKRNDTKVRLAALHAPRCLWGEFHRSTRAVRESNHAWLFRSGCLKIESECDVTYASATPTIVITGLDPVIHALLANLEIVVDGRVKPGHDISLCCPPRKNGERGIS